MRSARHLDFKIKAFTKALNHQMSTDLIRIFQTSRDSNGYE